MNQMGSSIFHVSEDERDFRAKPVRHFLAIAEMDNPQFTAKILDDWYLSKEKDYKSFAIKYPLYEELKTQNEKIIKMREWCENVKIKYTPTIFIDGFELPKHFLLSDINYFIS